MQDPSLWQPPLEVTLARTPDLRPLLGVGQTKLMTALTWTDSGLFLDSVDAQGPGSGSGQAASSSSYSYLETYSRLGFNTVPGHCRACPSCDWRCEKSPLFGAIFILKRSIYQDRLGTSIVLGKTQKREGVFRRAVPPWDAAPPSWAHPPGALAEEFAYAGNRTAAKGWSGLQYGPELSGFARCVATFHFISCVWFR